MATQYTTWLNTLGSVRADMPVSEQVRGLPVSHVITFPGNVTTATLAGAVKSSPDATAELATFTIGTPAFNSGTGLTSWTVSLSASQTLGLPADSDGDGVETFVYDFLLTLSGGPPRRIMAGLFPLSGFVTEPA
jgi:hypothetical protein